MSFWTEHKAASKTKMKPDIALDYVVFQLTPSRNRCELVVACGEETERLASGLLKPFLVHLKAAEEQYGTGTKEIKLTPPRGYGTGGKSVPLTWFTKGTIERFVRFVSTPEVLERVGTVEAELVQLQGAIRDHSNESTKVGAAPPSVPAVAASAASKIPILTLDQAPTPTPSRQNSLDDTESPKPDENARRRLLRAMDTQKMLLHKEQGMAFARATAAGFDMQKMEHLLVFADCFGATRLGDACVMYMGIFKKCKESGIWNENEWPLSDTTSLRNVPTSPELRRRESRDSDLWSDITSEAGDLRSHTRSPSKAGDYSSEFTRARGASSQASWDEGPESANGQPINTSLYSNGIGRWPISHSSQLPRLRHSLDASSSEPVNDLVDASNLGVHGQRHRRAWGPPPQYLAHQIPLAVKAKSGPLLSGSDGYHMTVRGNQQSPTGQHSGLIVPSRQGEAIPSWATVTGKSEPTGRTLPRVMVTQTQQPAQTSSSTPEQQSSNKPSGPNLKVLPSPSTSWQEHKRRLSRGVPDVEKGNTTPAAPPVSNTGHSSSVSKKVAEAPVAGVKATERPQSSVPAAKRSSSPRRRSSSPMRRVQVGRASVRRSGVVVKSASSATTKSTGNGQSALKEADTSDEAVQQDSGELKDSLLKQVQAAIGGQTCLGWRDGVRVETTIDSFKHILQVSLPDQSASRAPSGWSTPGDFDMDLSKSVVEQAPAGPPAARTELLSPKEPKGRFYEQYREKRDAKLREESDTKKAEKEAKLKSMQEVLERRKAEMSTRKGRGLEKQGADEAMEDLNPTHKLPVSKTDPNKSNKHKVDDEVVSQRRERTATRSLRSPGPTTSTPSIASTRVAAAPTTPTQSPSLIPTHSLTPKTKPSLYSRLSPPPKVNSSSSGVARGAMTPPTAPLSVPKVVRTGLQRRPQSAPPVENPLSRSLPSLAELRKENTKPVAVRNSPYIERTRTLGSKLPGARASATPLEPNSGGPTSRGTSTDDNKKRLIGTRKSVAAVADSSKEAPLKGSKAIPTAARAVPAAKPTKGLSRTSTASSDSKFFQRKGRGAGPASGPNVQKSKVAPAPEPTKTHDNEMDKGSNSDLEMDTEDGGHRIPRILQNFDVGGTETFLTRHFLTPPQAMSVTSDDDYELIRPEEWQEAEAESEAAHSPPRAPHSLYNPSTSRARFASGELHSSTLRHFLSNEATENSLSSTSTGIPPKSKSSPLHSLLLGSLTLKKPEVSSEPYIPTRASPSGELTSSQWVPYDLPLIPAPETLPTHEPKGSALTTVQLQQSLSPEMQSSSRLRKKWEVTQKAAVPPSLKESPRGLKRLLLFGRKKDRSCSASITSECPSDIDDDFDVASEHGGRTNEMTHIGAKSTGSRLPTSSKNSGLLMAPPAIPEDSPTEGDMGTRRLVSMPFARSSIPAAPAHFKTREEHVGGSSLLRAPRSFFSSFRGKVKQQQPPLVTCEI